MRKRILFASSGLAAAAVLGWLLMARTPGTIDARRRPRAVAASQETRKPVASTLQEAIRALPPAEGVARADILKLVREAADAYRSNDKSRFNAAFRKLVEYGSKIQRILAEILLDERGREERIVAGETLRQVATAEIAPLAIALVESDVAEDVQAVGIDLVSKFRVIAASPALEALLFRAETGEDLRRRAIAFFVAVGGAEVLARAAVEPGFGELRTLAADGLVRIGTAESARLLFAAWRRTFSSKSGKALENYYLLQALAKFPRAILQPIVRDFLKSETDPSAKNVFLSMLTRADRAFAIETIREVLAQETSGPLRKQALRVLASIGGRESQEILLGILAGAKDAKGLIEIANILLQEEKLEVSFDKMRLLLGSARDPMARALLAGLLGKYDRELVSDPSLVEALLREAEDGMASPDPAVRGLSVQLSASLANYGADPATNLVSLYGKLSDTERSAFPQVFSELSKRGDDPRVRIVLERELADESASTANRLMAADALFAGGGAEPVYGAIASSKNTETTSLLVGIALARGGNEAASRLERVAQASEDPVKKQAIVEQLKVWSVMQK